MCPAAFHGGARTLCGGSRAGGAPSARYGAERPRGGAAALPERRALGRPPGSSRSCVCPRPSEREGGFKADNFLPKAALSVAFRIFHKAHEAFDPSVRYFYLILCFLCPTRVCLYSFCACTHFSFLLSLDIMPFMC